MSLRNLIQMVCLAALLTTAGQVQAGFVTFNSFPSLNTALPSVSSEGLDFSPGTFEFMYVWSGFTEGVDNGTPALIANYGSVVVTKTGGGAFDLNAFDLGVSSYASSPQNINITYNYFGGGFLSTNISINSTSYTTVNYGGPTLTSFVIGGLDADYFALDNVAYSSPSAVPEPASMVIWGIGALGMGLVARRRAKKVATV